MASVNSVISKARAILQKCNEYTGEVSHDIWHAIQAVIDKSAGKIDPPIEVIGISENGEYDVVNYGTAIVDVQGGIDVSDTTATASDVISGKVFHTSDGASASGELVINSIIPSNSSPVALTSGSNYKPSASGYAISSYTSKTSTMSPATLSSGSIYKMDNAGYLIKSYQEYGISPTTAGRYFYQGWNYFNSAGYAYSSQPSGGMTQVGYARVSASTSLTIANVDLNQYNYVMVTCCGDGTNDVVWSDFLRGVSSKDVIFILPKSSLISKSPITSYFTGGNITSTSIKFIITESSGVYAFKMTFGASTTRNIRIYGF